MVPQTVSFRVSFRYDHSDRLGTGLPSERVEDFDVFEDMLSAVRKEKNRRAYRDRATSAKYRMVLTNHGREVCEADEYRRKSHADAIDGTWFKV